VVLLLTVATAVSAQSRLRATRAAEFLKEPGGLRLGSLVAGASYQTGKVNSAHVETMIDGWIPSVSVQPTRRDGFDLIVTADGGQAVRGGPGGSVIARVVEGTLLTKVGARGSWTHVRRSGWVVRTMFGGAAASSSAPAAAAPKTIAVQPPPPPPPPSRSAPQTAPPVPTTGQAGRSGAVPARDTASPKPDAPVDSMVSGAATLRGGSQVSATPDGKPLIAVTSPTDVEILDRSHDWVKVRFQGWVRTSDLIAETTAGPRITGAMVRSAPEKYVGQTVIWRLQFLSVQEADALRPEMPKGQLYVLARGPLPESGFAYLMVTKDQAATFQRLAPLDEVQVEAIIRAGRTRYLPTPVLEMVKAATR